MGASEALREARRALEGRLMQERALFGGCLAAFAAALWLDMQGASYLDPLVYLLVALCGLTGAGLDGAREGLKDIGLLAGLLEHEGVGARIARVPFWSRGHYEVWFETPRPGGARAFGLSFANSLLYREKRSRYLFMFPLEPGRHVLEGTRPREPYRETGTGGTLEGKEIEYWLAGPPKGRGLVWRLALYAFPGRPLDLAGALELKRRGEAMAEAISKSGAGAVQWGARERFRPLAPEEVPGASRVALREAGK
jgi:hypothetical protein